MNIIKLTLEQLLLSGIHLGYTQRFLNRQLKPYLLGMKGGFTIFNLKYVRLQVKLVLHLILNVTSLRQKILVVNHYPDMGDLRPIVSVKRYFLVDGAWKGGFLTNYKKIRLQTDYVKQKQPQLYSLTVLPSVVVFLNITRDNWGFKECLNLNIPTSIVTGSSFNLLQKVLYPVASNNQTLEVLIFYTSIIGNAVKKGLIKEKSNVFNLQTKLWSI